MHSNTRYCAGLPVLALALAAWPIPAPSRAEDAAAPAGSSVLGPGRYALVIGINDYSRTGLGDLRFSESDARAMRDVLVEHGGFPADHVRLMLGEEATAEAIVLYLAGLTNRTSYPDADTFVLYYSGHGGVFDSRSSSANAEGSRDNYLIPADGTSNRAMAARRNIGLDEMKRFLEESAFRRKVVLLDACRNVLQVDARGGGFAALDLAEYADADGLKIMTGTRFGEVSWEDEALGHGVFTYYLLEGLLGKGADAAGVVTLAGLELSVAKGMAAYSRDNPGRIQTPQGFGEGQIHIPLTLAPGAEAAARVLPARNASALLQQFGLPPTGQDEATVALAEQLLNAQGWLRDSSLPLESWRSVAAQLGERLVASPTPLGAYLASLIQNQLALSGDPKEACNARAVQLAQQAVKLAPQWPLARLRHGWALNGAKRHEEALAVFQAATELAPEWAEAFNGLGQAHLELKHYGEAAAQFKQALVLDPAMHSAHNNLANVYVVQGNLNEAVATYLNALELNPAGVVARNGLGEAYYSLERYGDAQLAFLTALQHDARSARAHNGLGNVHAVGKREAEAIREYRTAIQLDPGWAMPHLNLGDLYDAQERDDEALAEFAAAAKVEPDWAVPHLRQGWVLNRQHKYDESSLAFQRALQLDPSAAEPHVGLSHALYFLEKYPAAEGEAREAIRLDSKNSDAYFVLSAVLGVQGRDEEALTVIAAAIQLRPDWADAYGMQGEYYLALKRYAEALESFSTANQLDPGAYTDNIEKARRALDGPG